MISMIDTRLWRTTCLLLLALSSWSRTASPLPAATLHTDTFDTGTDGWLGGSSPVHVPSGGPAGVTDGFLSISSTNSNLATFTLESRWKGDLWSAGAAAVNLDLKGVAGGAPLAMRLVLMGPSSSVRWTSTVPVVVATDNVWRNYTFEISEDAMTQVLGVGSATWLDTLSNVDRVMLRHDPNGPSSTGTAITGELGIDNVRLETVPEPTAAVMLVLGLALTVVTRRFAPR
jgi:hypothetical protein